MKLKYIDALEGSLIAFIIFILLAFFIKGGGPDGQVELILTISTFLFAILSGFFISRANSRYNRMKEAIASEDANWLSFLENSKFFSKTFHNRVTDLIDQYYVIAFDYELGQYYKHNAKHLKQLYTELRKVDMKKNAKAIDLFDDLIVLLAQIEQDRNITSVISQEKLGKGQWAVLVSLAGIIIFSVYILKVPTFYSEVTTVLLSTILVLVLFILRDLDRFKLFGQALVVESGEEVFESMGKLRYYNKREIEQGTVKVPKFVKEYRVGYHEPGGKLNIKVEKNKNYEKPSTV